MRIRFMYLQEPASEPPPTAKDEESAMTEERDSTSFFAKSTHRVYERGSPLRAKVYKEEAVAPQVKKVCDQHFLYFHLQAFVKF